MRVFLAAGIWGLFAQHFPTGEDGGRYSCSGQASRTGSLGRGIQKISDGTRDAAMIQPSLTGLVHALFATQHCVLGYYQAVPAGLYATNSCRSSGAGEECNIGAPHLPRKCSSISSSVLPFVSGRKIAVVRRKMTVKPVKRKNMLEYPYFPTTGRKMAASVVETNWLITSAILIPFDRILVGINSESASQTHTPGPSA